MAEMPSIVVDFENCAVFTLTAIALLHIQKLQLCVVCFLLNKLLILALPPGATGIRGIAAQLARHEADFHAIHAICDLCNFADVLAMVVKVPQLHSRRLVCAKIPNITDALWRDAIKVRKHLAHTVPFLVIVFVIEYYSDVVL